MSKNSKPHLRRSFPASLSNACQTHCRMHIQKCLINYEQFISFVRVCTNNIFIQSGFRERIRKYAEYFFRKSLSNALSTAHSKTFDILRTIYFICSHMYEQYFHAVGFKGKNPQICRILFYENHFRTARPTWIYMTGQSLLMSETFYNIAKRARFERQIIRRSQFSKSIDCGIGAAGSIGGVSVLYGPADFCGLVGFGDFRNFGDATKPDTVHAGTIIEC